MDHAPGQPVTAASARAIRTTRIRRAVITLAVFGIVFITIPSYKSAALLTAAYAVDAKMEAYRDATGVHDVQVMPTRYSAVTRWQYATLSALTTLKSDHPGKLTQWIPAPFPNIDPEVLASDAIMSISNPATRSCSIFASAQAFDGDDLQTRTLRAAVMDESLLWQFLLYHEYAHCLMINRGETGFLSGLLLKHYEEAFADAFATIVVSREEPAWTTPDTLRLARYRRDTAPVGSIHRTGTAIMLAHQYHLSHKAPTTKDILDGSHAIAFADTLSWLDELDVDHAKRRAISTESRSTGANEENSTTPQRNKIPAATNH